MDGFWTSALAAFGGAVLGTSGTFLVERYRHKNRFQLVAIDKRLEVHQKAYALCAKLLEVIQEHQDEPELSDAVGECRYWWSENCLYLSCKMRKKFVSVCFIEDPESEKVINVMAALEREMGFRSLSSAWRKTKN